MGFSLDAIEIKPMTVEVLNEVLEIEKQSYPNPWSYYSFYSEITSNKISYYVTSNYEGKIIGYAGMWVIIDEGHITNIAVASHWRRRGVGEKLLRHLIATCEKCNVKTITLEVREKNEPALSLYQKYGFEVKGVRKNHYPETAESSLIMWLEGMPSI
ncbi:MAG: Ribosomal-protein-alanine acetyltransferase [candidate division WS2 bacterium]|nr:Ribosomal-protein-alanine acetyltransferase [Candidatus Lithacetigena glycinireducens]